MKEENQTCRTCFKNFQIRIWSKVKEESFKCPYCGSVNTYLSKPAKQSDSIPGSILVILGIFGLIYFFVADTSIPTGYGDRRVHNIGLMQQQQNGLIVSGLMTLVGYICVVAKRMKR